MGTSGMANQSIGRKKRLIIGCPVSIRDRNQHDGEGITLRDRHEAARPESPAAFYYYNDEFVGMGDGMLRSFERLEKDVPDESLFPGTNRLERM